MTECEHAFPGDFDWEKDETADTVTWTCRVCGSERVELL